MKLRDCRMRRFDQLLLLICDYFNQHNITYFIRGGVAVMLQGRFRTTEDIDINLSTENFDIEDFVSFCKRYDLSVDPYDLEAGKKDGSQITIMDFANSIRIDLKYIFTKWDKEAIKDVDLIKYQNVVLRVCKPEYLILRKIYKGSRIDIEDAYSVYFKNKNRLDHGVMESLADFFEIQEEFIAFLKRANIKHN